MVEEILAYLVFGFYFFIRHLILPIIGLINIIRILTLKKVINRAGKNYYKSIIKLNNNSLYIWIVLYIISLLIAFILSKNLLVLVIFIGLIIWCLGNILKNVLFGNLVGIYENGIILDNTYYKWEKIHSYKINETNIFGYLNNGKKFNYCKIENIDEINELFEKNKITKGKY